MLKAAQVGLGWWGSQVTKVLTGSDKIEIAYGIDPFEATAARYTA
ncbi:gfo/Idh/MocA family oxidoreductase, partial [bacterium]|nr:gfo/Idh/MocA family oxidoreductase [bacterium]